MDTTLRSGRGRSRAKAALAALFLGAFVVGTAELVVVGVLNLVARDMAVSIATVGTLVTAYALGISVGGPVLTALSMRLGRRFLLWLSLAAYVVGNVLAVVAVDFGMLLVARMLTGALHGLFVGVAFAVAAGLVSPERMGRAISVVFGGIAVSTALGVPLGTLIGQEFGWQATFVAIVVLGTVALAATLVFVPPVGNTGMGGFAAQARHALAPRVLAVLGVGFVVMGGQFAALTYLAPFLERVTGISGGLISAFLLAYGVANAVGTFAGGRFADRGAATTLVVANVLLIVALGTLYFAGSTPVLVALALGLWGLVGFGLVPSLQYRVVSLAGPGRDLAATLPASAVTAGIAAGALVGGWALTRGGVDSAVLAALIMSAIALPATWATGRLKTPAVGGQTAPNAPTEAPAGTR
jgi:MFS transporter, DHA1 family, inner membrane transport protein